MLSGLNYIRLSIAFGHLRPKVQKGGCHLNPLNSNKSRKGFKLSKPCCLKLSLNKNRCCRKSNQKQPQERVIVNISSKQRRRSFIHQMINKGLVVKRDIIPKVWDKDKQWKLRVTFGEEDWCDYLEVWWRLSVKRGNDFKFNLNRPEGGAKFMAKVMKPMKKVRWVEVQCKE